MNLNIRNQWIHPVMNYRDGIRESVYLGGVDVYGNITISQYNVINNRTDTFILNSFEVDDHNAPAIHIDADGYIHCYYARHGKDNYLRYRKSKIEESISNFENEIQIDMGGYVTYAQIFNINSDIYVICRVNGLIWKIVKNNTILNTLIDFENGYQGYVISKQRENDKIRFACYQHPKGDKNDIYYFYLSYDDKIYIPGGIEIADISTGNGLPLETSDLQLVYNAGSYKTRLYDVSKDDLSVLFARFTDTTDGEYMKADWNGSGFDISKICDSGAVVGYPVSWYWGGMNFSDDDDILLSKEISGEWYIMKNQEIIDNSTIRKLFRPQMTNNYISYIQGDYGPGYIDYNTDIILRGV